MSNRAAENKRLRDVFHFNGRLHARFDADLGQRAAQRQRVDHRGQHSHVIRGRSIHPANGRRRAAPDISAADDYRNLHPEAVDVLDSVSDLTDDCG